MDVTDLTVLTNILNDKGRDRRYRRLMHVLFMIRLQYVCLPFYHYTPEQNVLDS